MAVDSHTSISLVTDMVRSLLDSLSHPDDNHHPEGSPDPLMDTKVCVLSIANDF
jgi:hypothetical protein